MIGRMFTATLRYLGISKPQRRAQVSNQRSMSVAEYESIRPLSDAQVADFLACVKRDTAFHPILLAYISPPVDPLMGAEEGEEAAAVVCQFIYGYLNKNGLQKKGPNLRELGQLQRAAAVWAKENLSDNARA